MTAAPGRVGARTACRLASGPADGPERIEAAAIRHAVFVVEQGLFAATDADARDGDPATLHVLGLVDGEVAGTVRLYPLDPADTGGDWQGDRLAVLPGHRTSGLGGPLVRFAVATAAARGGRRMLAHVQPANGTFFRRLGWTSRGREVYVGRPHLLMDIGLRTLAPGAGDA